METVYEVAVMDNRRKLDSGQTVVEARLVSPSPIAKVLSLKCDCLVLPTETLNGEARYSGKVFYKALYLDTDGEARALDYTVEFSGSILSAGVKAGGKSAFTAAVLDTDVTAAGENEIKAAAVVEVTLTYIDTENVRYVARGGEDVYTLEDRVTYPKSEGSAAGSISATDTIENADIRGVVSAEARLVRKKKTAGVDSVLLSGEIVCDIVCIASDGLLTGLRSSTPFEEEVACHGARPDCAAVGELRLENVRVETIEGETFTVELGFDVGYAVEVFSEQSVSVIADAFSPTVEVIKTVEGITLCRPASDACVEETLDGSVTLKDEMPPADNVLAVTGLKCGVSDCKVEEGRVTVTGMATGSIVYFSAENNAISSAAFELPFSVATGLIAGADAVVSASGEVVSDAVRIRRGNELDIKVDVCFDVSVTESSTVAVVTDLKCGDAIAENDSAFTVYVARENETLFETAKALGLRPEQVVSGNPDLTFPLKGGERVVAFRHLERT